MAVQRSIATWPWLAVGLAGGAAIAVILGIDAWLWADQRTLVAQAVADETAHLLTAAILLMVLAQKLPSETIVGVLTGAVAIDIDHLPGLFGDDLLMRQTNRPFTHSLLVALIVAALALALPCRWRRFAGGLAAGIVVHFWRDLATSTAGVPLLWPGQTTGFRLPHELYLATLIGGVGLALWQRTRPGP